MICEKTKKGKKTKIDLFFILEILVKYGILKYSS